MLLLALLVLPVLAGAVSIPRHRGAALRARQTSAQCATVCQSPSDVTVLQQFQACEAGTAEDTCVCNYAFSLSSNCLSCVLAESSLTLPEFETDCTEYSSLASVPATLQNGATSGSNTAATTPAPSSSTFAAGQVGITLPTVGAGQATVTSQSAASPSGSLPGAATACITPCNDPSDLEMLQNVLACSTTDYACICRNTLTLSPACLSCFVSMEGETVSTYTTLCEYEGVTTTNSPAGGSSSSTGGSSSSTGRSGSSSTSTGNLPGTSAPPGFSSGQRLKTGGWGVGLALFTASVLAVLLG
ncbi:hypothetical protein CALVIDRAFT_554681 [Calocera viscosa TUFC12733]|uniref:Extracellular membrane protein CFEM domain-containing protein n=1 Tax=Calocera viscosa (strain TUFC12733) TaxID=1330018 RepID=A0A167MT85_CALVF|nr:hypothetical protein CALVIDRAFT_554681 [Calocera viscosa TUFC12733]